MRKTSIAVAGAGYIGQAQMSAAQASATVTLSAVVEPDGVVLATPKALHLPHAMECIAAKLPMLLEKPIVLMAAEAGGLASLRVAEAIVEAAHARTTIELKH